MRLLGEKYPLLVHTERLSLGAAGPADEQELTSLVAFIRDVKPHWVSDHLGFRCTRDVDLGSPVPLSLSPKTLDLMTGRVRRIMDACRLPLLLENLGSPLVVRGTLSEPEFLNRLCERTGCRVLLDVTALFVSSRNLGFDPLCWLHELDPAHILQVHVGGCRERDGRWADSHDTEVPEEVGALLREALAHASIEAVVLERDAAFPRIGELLQELSRLKSLTLAGGRVGIGT